MLATLSWRGRQYRADLAQPIDLSIPIRDGLDNPNCFWAPPVAFSPVVVGDFVGSTAAGGLLNFFNVSINPHGNGTHTECVGHIARERYVIYESLQQAHFMALLLSVFPQKMENGDRVVTRESLEMLLGDGAPEALVIRTLPNEPDKRVRTYSGANPPYLAHGAAALMAERGIAHLLIDLPSVDREEDEGRLMAHKAFWEYPDRPRAGSTITELIYVPDRVPDGWYLLNLQIASFDLDVSPSRPILYAVSEE